MTPGSSKSDASFGLALGEERPDSDSIPKSTKFAALYES